MKAKMRQRGGWRDKRIFCTASSWLLATGAMKPFASKN
jgi:hypothetical protein